MGRPKGSKNHKRKYTRRNSHFKSILKRATPERLAQGEEATLLLASIKTQLLEAEPEVSRYVIAELLTDLKMVAKIVEGIPPAP